VRLPTDATLLLSESADPQLERVWREERLPVLASDADLDGLETATVVTCEEAAARAAASLGFRTFLVGETAAEGVVTVSLAQAIDAARMARARERWKASR
jgi:hypothetical protein